jgi:predicted nucleic acid-binding protein
MRVRDPLPGLDRGSLLVLDTNALVYLVEGSDRRRGFMKAVWEEGRGGRFRFAVSALAWTELLAKPLSQGDEVGAERWRRLLAETPCLEVAGFDVAVAETAALLRARSGLALADAATLATALVLGAEALLTNDEAVAAAAVAGGGPRGLLIDELAWRFENETETESG